MTGNLQADGVQSRQTLFVRYCLNGKYGATYPLPKNKPAPTEVPVGAGFAASEQFHLFRYSRFTFSYACSLPRLQLPVQCLPE